MVTRAHKHARMYAHSQDTYGLEKLYHEEMCKAYAADFPLETRMARYHNVYGPRGTWKVGSQHNNTVHAGKWCTCTHMDSLWTCEGLWCGQG